MSGDKPVTVASGDVVGSSTSDSDVLDLRKPKCTDIVMFWQKGSKCACLAYKFSW